MMAAAQVRTFTAPKALGESLSAPNRPPASSRQIDRSVPTNGDTLNRVSEPQLASFTHTMGPAEGKSSYPGVTFAHQEKLAKLPIPDLESSCNRYLQALKPLQSAREHSDTRHAVHEFLIKEGPELQEKLKKYAEGRTSYIEQFCKFRCTCKPTKHTISSDVCRV